MTMHRIRIDFFRHGRIYRVGESHSFEEWPDETRLDEVSHLIASGHIEQPEPPSQEAPTAVRETHKNVRGAAADSVSNTKEG
ncbi:hypothetical protein [Falsiroseomonas sp. CW058]|uniref:hypothetical protein n=1 Tax=Falsiroseomonas sp. CW058 TaxID=3388664 RepID=UPI003D32399C